MVVYVGETVEIQNTITDKNGIAVDPDTHSITIYDPSGNLIATITNPTKVSTGVYAVDYTTPSAGPGGVWKMVWKITYGGNVGIETFTFNVANL